jgi:hypothetical protein
MQPVLLYYLNLLLCAIVFIELLFRCRKNTTLKVYFLLITASLFVINFYAINGVETRTEFIFVRFVRLVYVAGTVLSLVYLAQRRPPRWLVGLMIFAAVCVTGLRIANYHEINIDAVNNLPNPLFSVGTELFITSIYPRIMMLIFSSATLFIGYYYYRRLMIKLDFNQPHARQLSRWAISLVVPMFLLIIFGILANMKVVNSMLATYLFGVFSCTAVCSLIMRPRFLDTDVSGISEESRSAAMGVR